MYGKFYFHGIALIVLVSTFGTTAQQFTNDKDLKTVRCQNGGDWMIGNVPHPMDCTRYYSCVPAPIHAAYATEPKQMNCQAGGDGRRLYYDFRSCRCDYVTSVCFNGLVHNEEFFNCAQKYTSPYHADPVVTFEDNKLHEQ